jgi:hypothetical protein
LVSPPPSPTPPRPAPSPPPNPPAGKKRVAESAAEDAPAPKSAGKENKKKGAKKAKAEPEAAEPEADAAMADEGDDVKPQVGSGRQAAQNVQYKDKDASRTRKDDIIVCEDEPEADSESAAIRDTQGERPSSTRR